MLILIGTVPTAYALNRTMPNESRHFVAFSDSTYGVVAHSWRRRRRTIRATATLALRAHTSPPRPRRRIRARLAGRIDFDRSEQYHSLDKVPPGSVVNIRNDMYLAERRIRFLAKSKTISDLDADKKTLDTYKKGLDHSTKFIPTWVKVAVAIALGLGTMIGWKRIVVTVGEKIGKTHLTYAQGASAEIVAMATIGAAEMFGLPVSTTHVLSSGVAGTMVANESGLQWRPCATC